jgi:hypothetical protein
MASERIRDFHPAWGDRRLGARSCFHQSASGLQDSTSYNYSDIHEVNDIPQLKTLAFGMSSVAAARSLK